MVGVAGRHLLGESAPRGPEDNEFCVIEPGNAFLADCGTIGALSSNGSQAVGYFWSAALGRPLVWDRDEETAIRSPYGGPKITWGGPPQRPYRNRAHYDLVLPAGSDRQTEIDRLLSLGATRTGAQPDADGELTLADPDGNVFHLLPSRPGD